MTTIPACAYPVATPRKLPINIAWRAFGFVLSNAGAVMRIALVPFFVIIATYVLVYIYFPPQIELVGDQLVPQQQPIAGFITLPIVLLAATSFIVGIHRLAIKGERPAGLIYLRFQREELIYIGAGLLLTLVCIGVVGGLVAAAYFLVPSSFELGQSAPEAPFLTPAVMIAYFGGFILLIWPLVRSVLAFPHAAVSGKLDFGVSWAAMKGNFWRFALISILTGLIALAIYLGVILLITTIVGGGAALLPQGGGGDSAPDTSSTQFWLILAVPLALFVVFYGFMQAASITMLSFCYKALVTGDYDGAA